MLDLFLKNNKGRMTEEWRINLADLGYRRAYPSLMSTDEWDPANEREVELNIETVTIVGSNRIWTRCQGELGKWKQEGF